MKKDCHSSFFEELTSDQKNAAKSFIDWLDEDNRDIPFVLSGYAGSGKTFLSIRLLKIVESYGICWTAVAPTHKAVGVLSQALLVEGVKPTWYPSTIHRLLRLKLKRQGALEVCESTDQTSQSLDSLDLVLVDEASMIDKALLEIALQCAHPFKTRLVFVGDPAQLPPIGEGQSPVFSMRRTVKADLKEVVRHQGPVLKLAKFVRDNTLPCKQPGSFPLIKNRDGLVGCVPRSDWLKRSQQALRSASDKDDPDMARILCYTNRTMETLVPHARRAIHGEMADQLPVMPGEVLISRMAVMLPASCNGAEAGEEPDMVLGSNRELIVHDVVPHRCDLVDFGLAGDSRWSAPVIDTLLVKARSGELSLELRLLPHVGTEARELFDKTLKRLSGQAREEGGVNGRSLWRQFFLIRDAFASLGPAAVLTVHRSQGSSFGDVFVTPDVFWPKDPIFRRQLVYVALTRARKSVWFMGKDERNYVKNQWSEKLR